MNGYKICGAHKMRSVFVLMVVDKAYCRLLMALFFGDILNLLQL